MNQALWVLRKDLLIEWRARSRAFALACFALNVLLLFAFAVGPDTAVMGQHASAYLWLALLMTSTLLLSRSMQIETESGALDALVLAPVQAPALYYGKTLANALQLCGLAILALPIVLGLGDVGIEQSAGQLLVVVVLGCFGLAAPGTLYAALTARIPSQQLLMPLLMFPLIVPCLVAAVKATGLVLNGDPFGQLTSWLLFLVCFDVIYLAICGVLFEKVVSE